MNNCDFNVGDIVELRPTDELKERTDDYCLVEDLQSVFKDQRLMVINLIKYNEEYIIELESDHRSYTWWPCSRHFKKIESTLDALIPNSQTEEQKTRSRLSIVKELSECE